MESCRTIDVGVVGAVARGQTFAEMLARTGSLRCRAVCDTNEPALEEARRRAGADAAFADYEDLLARGGVEAVVIGTPMPLHVPMAVAALDRGIHVLSEVPAGVSVEECRRLVEAAARSRAVYMMGENYVFMRPNQVVRRLVREGLFGEPYYAEGEYLHAVHELQVSTPWRRRWQTGIDGVTYGTHSLGPILQWMPGQRVTSVCCAGSGRHWRDAHGELYENEDSCVMLCRLSRGGLAKIRVDMLSERPHAMTNYALQGTDGAYESARAHGERDRVWLRARRPSPDVWEDLRDLEPSHTPELWAAHAAELKGVGHGGGDLLELLAWRDAILGRRPNEIDVHAAMDMTLPGLVSQESIRRGGAWLPVPDSRDWVSGRLPPAQLHMIWPERLLGAPPEVCLPPGYEIDAFRAADEQALCDLMAKAGFQGWTAERVAQVRRTLIPGGWFVVRHRPSGALVATANANNGPEPPLFPEGGELGWVAADPAHAGKGLGRAVCAAVVRRFIEAGYRTIFLRTDDHRLPALKVYLDMGFEPVLFRGDMARRWENVRAALAARRNAG
jgi:predicted dehydrogenase/GNAT superfamily N-acetyltransferase